MADISKINPNDGTVYNIKDTTARNGLTDRPTSFVGTRSEWNALPVVTQVKYSLVNLKGEGVYKNNGTGLELIADVGMPESYPANQVMMSDGETSVEDRFNSHGILVKSVTADGIKTLSAILDELYSARSIYNYIDFNGLKAYPATSIKYSAITCTNMVELVIYSIVLKPSGSICKVNTMSNTGTSWTISDISNNVPTQGSTYRIMTMY